MFISWLLGVPFAGVLDPRFMHIFPLFAAPTPSLIVAMVVSLALMGLLGRRALNY